MIAHHANEIRLVFRHLPLTELHPNARLAAIAAVCADQQGKFWEMHDALFADRTALGVDALKSTAARVGLDGPRFAGCLDGVGEDSATAVVDMDAKAAMALGIHATPYFFVDGRPLAGEVSADQFETIIAEELQRLSTGR